MSEMAEPMASFIIPVYNCQKYLEACLSSVQMQTCPDYEVIIVDDGSEDESASICWRYVGKDNRFHYFTQTNKGSSSARNMGLARAKGKYVFFLDADDWIKPDLLVEAISQMEQKQLEMLYFNCEVQEGSTIKKGSDLALVACEDFSDVQRLALIVDNYLNYGMKYAVWNKGYRRSFLQEHHIFFDDQAKMGEDLFFNLKCLLSVKRIMGIAACLYTYRIHEDSVMGQMGKAQICLHDFSYMLEIFEPLYLQSGLPLRGMEQILIKTLDNQLQKRQTRKDYETAVKTVMNKKYLRTRLLKTLLKPWLFFSLYPHSVWLEKWKDQLYLLLCLR